MFLGSKFCGHCGAAAAEAQLIEDGDPGECPRCKINLQSLKVGTAYMRECERCGGFWTSIETFEHLCEDKEQQSAVLSYVGDQNHDLGGTAPINYVPCPDCKQLMNRSNFARASGVIIDTCKKHGVWLDADELPRIIDFIRKGGIEIARQRERNEIEREREQLREERHRLGGSMVMSGGDGGFGDDGSFIKSFVRKIFD